MEITYVGHACFLIRFDTGLTVCFDPYKPGSVPGLSDANPMETIVTMNQWESPSYLMKDLLPKLR